jgi:hypothetical protein
MNAAFQSSNRNYNLDDDLFTLPTQTQSSLSFNDPQSDQITNENQANRSQYALPGSIAHKNLTLNNMFKNSIDDESFSSYNEKSYEDKTNNNNINDLSSSPLLTTNNYSHYLNKFLNSTNTNKSNHDISSSKLKKQKSYETDGEAEREEEGTTAVCFGKLYKNSEDKSNDNDIKQVSYASITLRQPLKDVNYFSDTETMNSAYTKYNINKNRNYSKNSNICNTHTAMSNNYNSDKKKLNKIRINSNNSIPTKINLANNIYNSNNYNSNQKQNSLFEENNQYYNNQIHRNNNEAEEYFLLSNRNMAPRTHLNNTSRLFDYLKYKKLDSK